MTRLLVCLCIVTACAPAAPHWEDQVEAGGPCYAVNLLDGLDEESTQELHNSFDCLNQGGNLDPLRGVVDAMDATARTGLAAGQELASGINNLLDAGLEVFDVAGVMADLLRAEDSPLSSMLELSAEVLYGRVFSELTEGTLDLAASDSLDAGGIKPLIPVLGAVATAALDDDLLAIELMAEGIDGERILSILHSMTALIENEDEEISEILTALPADLGDALERAQSPENDRWGSASGNSLKDLAIGLFGGRDSQGQHLAENVGSDLRSMSADSALGLRLEEELSELSEGGHLLVLPVQLTYLAEVDAYGGSLSPGEDAALFSMLRMLERGNAPLECSVNLGWTSWDFSLPNLSVSLLERFAALDADATVSGVELLGDVLGSGLSEAILEQVADLGVCPTIDQQMIADLHAIDRFNDAATGDLLVILHGLLDAIHVQSDSKVPELVNLLAGVHAVGVTAPLEEALRDLGSTSLARHLVSLLPTILDTSALDDSSFPSGVTLFDFAELWAMLGDLCETRDSGRSALSEIWPILEAGVTQTGTWSALENIAPLLGEPNSRTSTALTWFPTLLAADPDLSAVRSIALPLLSSENTAPFLRVLETSPVTDALAGDASTEGPLGFYGQLVVSGALHSLLVLVDDLLDILD